MNPCTERRAEWQLRVIADEQAATPAMLMRAPYNAGQGAAFAVALNRRREEIDAEWGTIDCYEVTHANCAVLDVKQWRAFAPGASVTMGNAVHSFSLHIPQSSYLQRRWLPFQCDGTCATRMLLGLAIAATVFI